MSSAPSIRTTPDAREALGSYILYRQVQRAKERGRLPEDEAARVSDALRDRVVGCWDRLFPGGEKAARAWARSRLSTLLDSARLPSNLADALRRHLASREALAVVATPRGSLDHLRHVHYLYLEIMEAMEGGEMDRRAVPAVQKVLHEQSLRAVNLAVRRDGALDTAALGALMSRTRELLEETGKGGYLEPGTLEYLRGILSPEVLPSGSGRGGIGTCEVCGFSIEEDDGVLCTGCESPHHGDCWTYTGGCSTFACMGRKCVPFSR